MNIRTRRPIDREARGITLLPGSWLGPRPFALGGPIEARPTCEIGNSPKCNKRVSSGSLRSRVKSVILW